MSSRQITHIPIGLMIIDIVRQLLSSRAIVVIGRLFSLVSGIVALAALAGTINTIVTGSERFVQIVTGWVR